MKYYIPLLVILISVTTVSAQNNCFWFPEANGIADSIYTLSSLANGVQVDAKNADPYHQSFGFNFGKDPITGESITIDMTNSAILEFTAENPSADSLSLMVYLRDIYGKDAYLQHDTLDETGTQKEVKYFKTDIKAGATETLYMILREPIEVPGLVIPGLLIVLYYMMMSIFLR